jgi:hypothetical protein
LARAGKTVAEAVAVARPAWRGRLAGRRPRPGGSPPGGDRSIHHDMHHGS